VSISTLPLFAKLGLNPYIYSISLRLWQLNMGLQVKNNANGKKRPFNVVSNKDTNVGISKK